MPLQPFTPAGLSDKIAEFYAMTDVDLLTTARQFADDFKKAMLESFIFTADQSDYLGAMSDASSLAFGGIIASVLIIRGPISMTPVPVQVGPKRPKEIFVDVTGGGLTYVDGPVAALDGTLGISITWELK